MESIMRFRQAREFINQHAISLLADSRTGLIGLAVGRKDEAPITGPGEFCVTAFVEHKLPVAALRARQMSPFEDILRNLVPAERSDADVVEIGDSFRLHAFNGSDHANPATVNTQKWFATPRSGISICNPMTEYPKRLDAGTLGFFVEDGEHRYLLSSNHVIARRDTGQVGESIVQPGTIDLNGSEITAFATDADVAAKFAIAELTYKVPIQFDPPGSPPGSIHTNKVDTAIARLISSDRSDASHARLGYGGRFRGFGQDYKEDATGAIIGSPDVTKVGRSTGYTEGCVTNIAAVVTMPFGGGRTATFVDQIGIRPSKDNSGVFSSVGDSGSALVNHDHEIVGLIFAGGPRRSLANPISTVLQELSNQAGGATFTLVK
jgi:hypothetical protein